MSVFIRLLPVVVLLTALLLPGSAHGQTGPVSASSTSGSVKLTISLDREAFPQNALALVTLTVANVGKKAVSLQTSDAQCDAFQPSVGVLDASGRASQLATAGKFIPMPCPAPTFRALPPGHYIRTHQHVVLSGPQILASQTFGSRNSPRTVTTPPITLALTKSAPATIKLNASGPFADVARQSGRLYYTQSARCPGSGGTTAGSDFSWVRAKSTRITPFCTPVSEWHVIAGYVGKSVATLDYTAPVPTPTP